jgi:hypothetical protein
MPSRLLTTYRDRIALTKNGVKIVNVLDTQEADYLAYCRAMYKAE